MLEGRTGMKKFMLKLIFWLIIFCIIGLAGYQNLSLFMSKYAFSINYYFGSYSFPQVYTGLYCAGFFMVGFVLASIFSIGFKFRTNRIIKQLKNDISLHERSISALRNGGPKPAASPDTGQIASES